MNDFLVPLLTFIILRNAIARPRLQRLFSAVLALSTLERRDEGTKTNLGLINGETLCPCDF